MDTRKAPAMDTGIQQDLAQTAVSDPLAGDGSWIIWPAENDFSTMGFSTMGRDRGTFDVMGPGGFPCPSSDFSTMGRDRGTFDVMGPGGSPRETASFPTRRVKTPSR
jgi:hypothetical protein